MNTENTTMTNDCKTCPVSTGTHKPAEAVHQIAEPAAQTPEDAQIQALMRKHRIWIEHSTLLEGDEPERELRAVQAEEHQFNAFVQDLIAATQLAEAPQAVQAATHPTPQGLELANCKGGKWLTVVYRDIQPGDEARTIGEHPKVSALSWSHALNDRDAALAAQAKQGGADHG